eukprot:9526783-Prorocentrum_lima.AAC.1
MERMIKSLPPSWPNNATAIPLINADVADTCRRVCAIPALGKMPYRVANSAVLLPGPSHAGA